MPSYEMALLLKSMPKQEIKVALKRTASSIFEKGGIIRSLDFLGLKKTPYTIRAHGANHNEANYFIMKFDVPTTSVTTLHDEYKRDVDIIKRQIFKNLSPGEIPELEPACTLHDDLQPPVYRKAVKELIEKAKKLDKPKFQHNTGLDYYPFQR